MGSNASLFTFTVLTMKEEGHKNTFPKWSFLVAKLLAWQYSKPISPTQTHRETQHAVEERILKRHWIGFLVLPWHCLNNSMHHAVPASVLKWCLPDCAYS